MSCVACSCKVSIVVLLYQNLSLCFLSISPVISQTVVTPATIMSQSCSGCSGGEPDNIMLIEITGCPISQTSLCFCHFLGFWSTYRRTSDHYSTALEICYMIGTRILKIDLEIAEIFEVKVGTRHLEIDILLLHRVKKIILVSQVPTLTSIISAIFESIFKILVAIM